MGGRPPPLKRGTRIEMLGWASVLHRRQTLVPAQVLKGHNRCVPRRPLTLNDAPRVARFLTEWWIPIDVAQLRRDWERDGFELGRDSWLATDSDRETVAFGCIYPEGWAVAAATTETDYREVVSELRSRAHGGVIRMLESTANGARLAVLREQGFAETAQFTQWRL